MLELPASIPLGLMPPHAVSLQFAASLVSHAVELEHLSPWCECLALYLVLDEVELGPAQCRLAMHADKKRWYHSQIESFDSQVWLF